MRFGQHCSDETKAKISTGLMGNQNGLGHSPSEKSRAEMSAALRERYSKPEEREKSSAARMGHAVSPETRAKISAANWRTGSQESKRKIGAKRRKLGFIPLNAPFAGCEGHHVDDQQVIHVPKALHDSIRHNLWTGRNMAQINAVAYNFLFKQEVEAAMAARG